MKPTPSFQIEQEKLTSEFGKFVIEPLEQGYGHTIGTALRRVLLTGLSGAAITQIKISGMKHQFSPIKGVKEDGVDLLLNLKKVRVSYSQDKPAKLSLSARGKGEVCAKDIKVPADVKIANPDFVIATLANNKSKLDIEMQVEAGIGYSPAEDRKTNIVGLIPLDADFSPVKRVNYKVEETRVGGVTNYDKLTIEIWTDGSLNPDSAIKTAAEILVEYLNHLVSPTIRNNDIVKIAKPASTNLSKISVEELSLPTRITNALVGVGYETVENLVKSSKTDIAKIRNLGEKSVKIIQATLQEKGVSWGK